MQPRESFKNLVITCVLVLLVALFAFLLRECHSVPAAIPVPTAPAVENAAAAPAPSASVASQPAPPAKPPAPAPKPGGPVARPASATFLTLPKTKLLDAPANEADTLRIRTGDEEHTFVLYYIDALDASATHPDRVAAQAKYFGNVSQETVLEFGREALDYVTRLLNSKTFHVLTRWERVEGMDRYYALIRVEYEKGRWIYLTDLLMRQGYARIYGMQTPMPEDGPGTEPYMAQLLAHGKFAKQNKVGIWVRAK